MHPQYATAGKQTKSPRQRAGKKRHQSKRKKKIQDIFAPTVCPSMQTNKITKTKSWQEETSERRKKIQDISEEKGAPKTTKQTVTLTTVAGQKVQEKSLNGTYRLYTKKNLPRKPSVLILS